MADEGQADVEATIDQFASGLKELVQLAKRRIDDGAPTSSIPDLSEVSAATWSLGLIGARLDELMKQQTGLHAPVIASYEGSQTPIDQVDDVGQDDIADVPRILRLEFVLRSAPAPWPTSVAAILDEHGQGLVNDLSARGLVIEEWGASIDSE